MKAKEILRDCSTFKEAKMNDMATGYNVIWIGSFYIKDILGTIVETGMGTED